MATGYWRGADNATWTTTTNWWTTIGGTTTVATVPGAGETAFFNANGTTTARNVYLNGSRSVGTLSFNSNNGSISLFGGTSAAPTTQTLTLGSGGIDMSASGGNFDPRSSVNIALTAALTPANVNAARGLFIFGIVSGAGFGWNVNGGGVFLLANANTYSGGTTISNGVMQISNNSALGTGTVTMTGGALSSNTTTAYSLTNALSLNGTITLGDATNTGLLTFSGTTTIAGTTTLTVASAVTFSGSSAFAMNAALTKTGTGDLTLLSSVAGTGTGIFTQNGGTTTLAAQGSGTPNQLASVSSIAISSGYLNVFGSGSYTFDRTITGAGSGGGFTCGHPNLTLSGSLSGYSGPFGTFSTNTIGTTITATFTTSASFPRGIQNFYAGNSTAPATQTLKYTGTDADVSTSSNYTFTPDSNQSLTAVLWNASTNGKALTFSGAMTHVRNTNAVTLQLTTDAAAGLLTLSGIISQSATGVLSITKTGTNAATLSGANAFTGNVTVSAGTLNANSVTALGADTVSSQVTVSSGAVLSLGALPAYTQRSLTFTGTGITNSAAVVLAAAGTHRFGAVTVGGPNTYLRASQTATLNNTVSASGLSLDVGAAATKTITFPQAITVQTLNVSAYAQDTGTVALNAANTISSTTGLFSNGTLSLGNSGALGASTLVFNGGTLDASTTLTVANALTVSANITFAGTASLTLSSAMALGASRTITTDGSGGALTLSGIVSGATFKLTKAGTNTLKLTNANTYSGGTDIGAGTVQAGNTQALGTSGTVTLTASGATLQTLTTGGQNGKLTVAALTNSAGGTIKIGG